MHISRTQHTRINQFIKFISVQYGVNFSDEINLLNMMLDECEIGEELGEYWSSEFYKLKQENEMLRKDLQELNKKHCKNINNGKEKTN